MRIAFYKFAREMNEKRRQRRVAAINHLNSVEDRA